MTNPFKKIKDTSTTGKFIVVAIFIYYITLNVFSIFKLQETSLSGLLPLWNTACFVILSISLLYSERLRTISSKQAIVVTLFIVSNLLTMWIMITDPSSPQSLLGPAQLMPLAYLILFMLLMGESKVSPLSFLYINKMVAIFAVFACILSLAMNASYIANDLLFISNSYEAALSSFFSNRNSFGFFLVVALASTFLCLLNSRGRRKRLLYVATIILFIASLILTMSRTAMIAFVIFIAIFSVIKYGIKGIAGLLLGLALAIMTTYAVLGQTFVESNIIRAEAGTTGRDILQEYGIDYYKSRNVIMGSGVSIPSHDLTEEYGYSSFHSSYITILTEGGLVLAAAHIALLATVVKNIYYIRKYDKNIYALLLSLLIAFLVYDFMETNILFRFEANSMLITTVLVIAPLYLVNFLKQQKRLAGTGDRP